MTGICEHGFLDEQGCPDCDMALDGRPFRVEAGLLLLVVLAAGLFLAGRWVGDRLESGGETATASGVWCGQADEVVDLRLDQGAAGELNGELSLGGRDFMVVAGRVEDGGIVTLQTVDSATRFELSGALVEGRLRLNVIDDAGDVARVELRHC